MGHGASSITSAYDPDRVDWANPANNQTVLQESTYGVPDGYPYAVVRQLEFGKGFRVRIARFCEIAGPEEAPYHIFTGEMMFDPTSLCPEAERITGGKEENEFEGVLEKIAKAEGHTAKRAPSDWRAVPLEGWDRFYWPPSVRIALAGKLGKKYLRRHDRFLEWACLTKPFHVEKWLVKWWRKARTRGQIEKINRAQHDYYTGISWTTAYDVRMEKPFQHLFIPANIALTLERAESGFLARKRGQDKRLYQVTENLKKTKYFFKKAVAGNALKDTLRGRTLYIVAPGPSLNKNYKELNRVDKEDKILVLNAALSRVERADFFFFLDWGQTVENVRHGDITGWVESASVKPGEIDAIFLAQCHPSIMDFEWRRVFAFRQFGHDPLARAQTRAHPGFPPLFGQTSVITSAFHLAWMMKPRRIVLAGLDNCIYPDGSHHFDDATVPVSANFGARRDDGSIKGIDGREIGLNNDWISLGMKVNACCDFLIDGGIEVVNATEGGVINNVPCPTLKEAIDGQAETGKLDREKVLVGADGGFPLGPAAG